MKRGFTLVALMIVIAIIGILFVSFFPAVYRYTSSGRGFWNRHMYSVQKTDDATRYETMRTVEDTCRAMQASYQADVATYEMYARSGKTEWAQQVAIRANRTAASYNEYVLKNSFVWAGNVPADIKAELPLVH